MKAIIALIAAGGLLLSVGCTTPYNRMNSDQRFVSFRQQCSAAGHTGAMVNICAADMEQQFKTQRKHDVAVGVAVVAIGAIAILAAAGSKGGGAAPSQYNGNCQYDWQYDAAGNRCGHRSAFSKPGGYQ